MSALRLLFVDGGRGAYRTPRAHGTARRCATYRCDGRGAVRAVLTLTRRAPAGRGRGRCRLRGSGGVTARFRFGSVRSTRGRGRSPRPGRWPPAADASRRMPMLMLICTDMPHKPSNSMPIAHADRVLNPDGGRCRTAASRLPDAARHLRASIGPRPRARAVTGLLRLDTRRTLHTTQNYTGRGTT